MSQAGALIVIEGADGSGKSTQLELLVGRLQDEGYDVAVFDFPQYDSPSSYFVKRYLNGEYGNTKQVGPYTASLFYALDRYEAASAITEAIETGKVVIANRYTGSSMAHQGTKFTSPEERRGFFIWLDNLEFQMLKIPRPTVSFVLRVPANIAQTLVDQKDERSYTDKKRDIHEADLQHLVRAVEVYDDMTQLFPKDFIRIDCIRGDKLLEVETIRDLLWERIKPVLPPKPEASKKKKTKARAERSVNTVATTSAEPTTPTQKSDQQPNATESGEAFLAKAVTNPTRNVYAFTNQLNSETIAAALVGRSQQSQDLRTMLLDKFVDAAARDESFSGQAVAAYGDNSVKQLIGQYIVVEEASNLLAKKLEWGRLGAYIEQSPRYIDYGQKGKNGHYKYYTPEQFDRKTAALYTKALDTIFDAYTVMVRRLVGYIGERSTTPMPKQDEAWRESVRSQACDVVRPVLPVATQSTVGIFASAQTIENLITRLQSDEFPEARQTGDKIFAEVRKILPTIVDNSDKATAYYAKTRETIIEIADRYLPDNHASETEPIQLVDVWPRSELDLVPDMLYEHSTLSLRRLRSTIESWPYDKKTEVFNAYIGDRLDRHQRPGCAFEKVRYSWDLVCDYGTFRELQRHRIMVDDLAWQPLTPRYGYEVPQLVEEAGLTDLYEKCFDISLELYSQLQASGHPLEAQYVTLLGHKMRWKVTYNAREAFHIHELRANPQSTPDCRKLVALMHEKLAEVHPLTAEAMKFVHANLE